MSITSVLDRKEVKASASHIIKEVKEIKLGEDVKTLPNFKTGHKAKVLAEWLLNDVIEPFSEDMTTLVRMPTYKELGEYTETTNGLIATVYNELETQGKIKSLRSQGVYIQPKMESIATPLDAAAFALAKYIQTVEIGAVIPSPLDMMDILRFDEKTTRNAYAYLKRREWISNRVEILDGVKKQVWRVHKKPFLIKKVEKKTAHEETYNAVVDFMKSRKYKRGDKLPTIQEMSDTLNTNYSRIALVTKRMVASGILSSQKRGGITVVISPFHIKKV
jgi:DNA-binding transcriptional regulator YhcF (GntR family)